MSEEGSDVVGDLVKASVGVVRVGAGVGWRVASFGLRTTGNLTARMVEAARDGSSASRVLEATIEDVRREGRDVFGIGPADELPAPRADRRASDRAQLRRRGRELLRRSVDVDYVEDVHPAYDAILDVLAPDEGRILRHLALDGAQPAVDVRATSGPSALLAPGVSLIGETAGVRFLDRTSGYLNNLHRLGLVWFSRESIEPSRYEMLEAQPAVQQALKAAKRTRTVRRSIELTPFGRDFVGTCIPLDEP